MYKNMYGYKNVLVDSLLEPDRLPGKLQRKVSQATTVICHFFQQKKVSNCDFFGFGAKMNFDTSNTN